MKKISEGSFIDYETKEGVPTAGLCAAFAGSEISFGFL